MRRDADRRAADPAVTAASDLGRIDAATDSKFAGTRQANPVLRAHFDRAVDLLEQKAALAADIAEWRREVRGDGLVPPVLLKLAREHLRDAEQQRKAAEAVEVERLYRQGLGLPLFDWAAG